MPSERGKFHPVFIRLTENEKEKLRLKVEAKGATISGFVRNLIKRATDDVQNTKTVAR